MACDAASRTAALLLMGRDRGLGRHGLRCCQTHVGAAAHWPIVRVEDELAAGVVSVGDAREREVGDDDGVDMRGLGREPDDSDGVGSRYAPICTNSIAEESVDHHDAESPDVNGQRPQHLAEAQPHGHGGLQSSEWQWPSPVAACFAAPVDAHAPPPPSSAACISPSDPLPRAVLLRRVALHARHQRRRPAALTGPPLP